MNFNILYSLQHLAAVKISIAIFYDSEIEKILLEERKYTRYIFCSKFNRNRHDLWKLIQIKAAEKLPCLPNLIRARVCNYIQPLHLEAEDWIKDYCRLFKLDHLHCRLVYKSFLCWNTNGSINRIETAKKIVQNKIIDPNTRFILACIYFLEDEVFAIWNGEKEVTKKSICQKGTNSAVRFWLKWLRKKSVTPWKNMVEDYFSFLCLRRYDIPIRSSSFFPYLSQESRSVYFGCLNKDEFFSCISKMEEAERTELLQTIPQDALLFCSQWPFQTLFIDMAKQIEGTKYFDFELVFLKIVSNIKYELEDFDYVGLLKELWNSSPSFREDTKESITHSKMICAILNYNEDSQSLPLGEILSKYRYNTKMVYAEP